MQVENCESVKYVDWHVFRGGGSRSPISYEMLFWPSRNDINSRTEDSWRKTRGIVACLLFSPKPLEADLSYKQTPQIGIQNIHTWKLLKTVTLLCLLSCTVLSFIALLFCPLFHCCTVVSPIVPPCTCPVPYNCGRRISLYSSDHVTIKFATTVYALICYITVWKLPVL